MVVYKLVWEDRNGSVTEWLGTKKELSARKASINKLATSRPYDQVEIVFSGQVGIPTGKAELLEWLNHCVR